MALGDPAGEPLLAVVPQDPAELGDRVGVDDVCRRTAGRRIHPHVEPGVAGVGETPLVSVELHRGDAQVEQHPVDPLDAGRPQDLGQRVVDAVDQRDAVAVSGEPGGAASQGRRITVDADQPKVRVPGQQGRGVAAEPQRRVHEDGGLAAGHRSRRSRTRSSITGTCTVPTVVSSALRAGPSIRVLSAGCA